MNPMPPPMAVMAIRMKPLSPRHRIAHLRALISELPDASIRREQLGDELTAPPANETRAP